MPSIANAPFSFGLAAAERDAPSTKSCRYARQQKDRLKAFKPSISPELLAAYKEEYDSNKDNLQHISFTEYSAFVGENRMYILHDEIHNIRVESFGFPVIQHSEDLVSFYTGISRASQFYYINSLLQGSIFPSYMKWDDNERKGFLNHTMIVLMKLRLNMTDEELAKRFGIEPYIVNMTLRTWLPELHVCVYKTSENVYRNPRNGEDFVYSKVLDIVQVCFETPENTRCHRDGQNEARKAVLSVRYDGFVSYASPVVSDYRPDDETIRRSRFGNSCCNLDVVAVRPEHFEVVSSMGIACFPITIDAETNIEGSTNRLAEFRILMSIPSEYKTFQEYIFPICAALSNFRMVDDDYIDPAELPDLQHYEEEI